MIISGITNTGKETLAKLLSDFDFGTISSNISLHTFDGNRIGLIHASSIENASLVYSEVYNAPSSVSHIHIEREGDKYFLELNNSTMEQSGTKYK